jgi:hypothetical protein
LARLSIPTFGDDQCDFLRATVAEILDPSEFAELSQFLGTTGSEQRLRSTALGGTTDDPVLFRQSFLLHAVTREEATDEAGAMRDSNPSYPAAENIAAHLHIDYTLEDSLTSDVSETSVAEKLDCILDWLREKRKELEVTVVAGRTFEAGEFEPIVDLPEPTKPFTSVRGITLVRESDTPAPKSVVYEVHVRMDNEVLPVSVTFRSKMSPSSDALEKLLQQASEIAAFGVRRRLATIE